MEGKHYARTCEDWLARLLKDRVQAKKDLKETYGDEAEVWYNRWIVFYLVLNSLMAKLMLRVAQSYLHIITGTNGLWHIISFQKSRLGGINALWKHILPLKNSNARYSRNHL